MEMASLPFSIISKNSFFASVREPRFLPVKKSTGKLVSQYGGVINTYQVPILILFFWGLLRCIIIIVSNPDNSYQKCYLDNIGNATWVILGMLPSAYSQSLERSALYR